MPERRVGRCRRRPQTKGCRWSFQYAVARFTAVQISSHVSNRRPLIANDRSTVHHGSIRFREAADGGWKPNSQCGWVRLHSSTSLLPGGSRECPEWRRPAPRRDQSRPPPPPGSRPNGRSCGPVGRGARRARGRWEGAEDIARAPPSRVSLLRCAVPGRIADDQAPSGDAVGALRAHLVQAHRHAVRRRVRVKADDRPLCSAKAGSTRSPNQVS